MRLRESFYTDGPREPTTQAEIDAVLAITENFEPRWRLAMAANLFALRPRQDDDLRLLDAFHKHFHSKHAPHQQKINCRLTRFQTSKE
jgi:hypothetical protein